MKRNAPPDKGVGMVYYVNGPAVDYDGDGKLDVFGGIWPEENSHLFHNETPGGNWLPGTWTASPRCTGGPPPTVRCCSKARVRGWSAAFTSRSRPGITS